jgi:hypothetical protein
MILNILIDIQTAEIKIKIFPQGLLQLLQITKIRETVDFSKLISLYHLLLFLITITLSFGIIFIIALTNIPYFFKNIVVKDQRVLHP